MSEQGKTIIIERGCYRLGVSDGKGNVTQEPKWINDGISNGIVVAIQDEYEPQTANDGQLFGIYQLDRVLDHIKKLLNIKDRGDEVNYFDILHRMEADGNDVCEYCESDEFACRECKLKNGWRNEAKGAEQSANT